MNHLSDQEPVLHREDANGVATLTLNRPTQFNALSKELLTALQTELAAIAGDKTIRVVVIAAAGKAFCVGHDLKEMRANHTKTYMQDLFGQCGELMLAITRLPQPVISRVHGVATAAGCQLVATCDLAIAAEQARFAVSGINVGLFCSTPAVPLSRAMARKAAMEMLLTGEFIDAAEAVRRGLINRAVPAESLDSEVQRLVDSIGGKSSVAIAMGKQLFYQQLDTGLEAAYQLAAETMACNMMTQDAAEGIDAFMQKRAPTWRGT